MLREDEFVVKLVNKLSHRNISIPFNLDRDLSKLIKKTFSAIATGELIASHTLVGYAKLFDIDDKAIRESLIRKIRIALEKELISNVSLVKAINLIKQGDDLIVTIVISHNH